MKSHSNGSRGACDRFGQLTVGIITGSDGENHNEPRRECEVP